MQTGNFRIRQATKEDFAFIESMCYESSFPDYLQQRPSMEEVRKYKWFQGYTRDWPGHQGDYGVIAEDTNGVSLGAAWYRDYWRKDMDESIPTHELSIAVIPKARGKGIGKKLILELLEGAAKQGVAKLSLHVRPENTHAMALYEQFGFQTVALSSEGYNVMVAVTPTYSARSDRRRTI